MSMKFPYKNFRVPNPLWPLRGRNSRPRPVLTVSMVGPAGTYVDLCLLDTGSDDTIFHESVAQTIGVDLTSAPTSQAAGVGQRIGIVRYAEVPLRLTGNGERHEWMARVGFTAASLRRPLLGFAGFLEYFTATFHGDLEVVELDVNATYPGS